MSALGDWLHTQRIAHGWSLSDLSEACMGLSKGMLSELERGQAPCNPSLETLERIGIAFGIGAGDVLVQAGYTVGTEQPAPVVTIEVHAPPGVLVRVTGQGGVETLTENS